MNNVAVKIIKGLNILSAVVLAFAGLWIAIVYIAEGLSMVGPYFLPFFLVLFGFLLVANELGKGKILDEFGFMKTFLGKGLFYIFQSANVSMSYAFITKNVIAGDVYGIIFFCLGIIYLLMNFYPRGQLGNLSKSLQH